MVKHGDVESIVKYSCTWFSSQPHVEFQAQIFKVQAFKHRAVVEIVRGRENPGGRQQGYRGVGVRVLFSNPSYTLTPT
jgi:hypothetical protein